MYSGASNCRVPPALIVMVRELVPKPKGPTFPLLAAAPISVPPLTVILPVNEFPLTVAEVSEPRICVPVPFNVRLP